MNPEMKKNSGKFLLRSEQTLTAPLGQVIGKSLSEML